MSLHEEILKGLRHKEGPSSYDRHEIDELPYTLDAVNGSCTYIDYEEKSDYGVIDTKDIRITGQQDVTINEVLFESSNDSIVVTLYVYQPKSILEDIIEAEGINGEVVTWSVDGLEEVKLSLSEFEEKIIQGDYNLDREPELLHTYVKYKVLETEMLRGGN